MREDIYVNRNGAWNCRANISGVVHSGRLTAAGTRSNASLASEHLVCWFFAGFLGGSCHTFVFVHVELLVLPVFFCFWGL